ncbi:DUF362 domain-containing protein [candidate division KSB1 bacterium]
MSENTIDRRDFLKKSTKAGIAAAASTGLGFWLSGRSRRPVTETELRFAGNYAVELPSTVPPMVVVRGEDPAMLATAAIESMGGMKNFVSPGDVVVLKPNIGWDRVPRQAANTNPYIVQCVVRHCFDAGAKKVVVTDVSCNDARRCFQRSGIAKAAEEVGADVVLPEDRKFRDYNMNGEILSVWPLFTPIVEADKVINLPIVKHHNLAKATMGMKNWYGIIGGRRNQLHQNIDVSIADLAAFIKPTLTIMDAYRVLMANGPQGGNIKDVKEFKTVIAGIDQVAVDAYGASFLGLPPEQIAYIQMAHDRGVGNMDYKQLNIKEVQV